MPCRPARWAAAIVIAAALVVMIGCGREPEIRSYDVQASTPKPAPPPAGEAKVRLLGAIIPAGDESWFLKFSGPIDEITPHEKDFDAFLGSIKMSDDPRAPPTWTAPPGWKEAPRRQMRVVTFLPPGGKGPELYLSEPFRGSLLANVNRWRDEVGIANVEPEELAGVTTEVTLGSQKAYRVDFRGPGGKGGMMQPPFAK